MNRHCLYAVRALTIALCLLVTPTLAGVAGVASVKRAARAAYAEHLTEVVGWRPGGSPSSLRVSAALKKAGAPPQRTSSTPSDISGHWSQKCSVPFGCAIRLTQ